jgi:hypothetical protein
MDERVRKLVRRMHDASGKRDLSEFIMFLDTSAIIDSEGEIKKWRTSDGTANISGLYERLYQKLGSRGFPIFVTGEVLNEARLHHEFNRLNGRPEVSAENLEIVSKAHEAYHDFLLHIAQRGKDFDQIRYDTYWASKLAFADDVKKGERDPIARTDRELLAAALYAKHCVRSEASGNGAGILRPIEGVIVLSADDHLTGTLDVLTGRTDNREGIKFGYGGVYVIRSR